MAVKKATAQRRRKAEEQPEKKAKGATGYPPYVNAYGSISKLFEEISKASVPPKFTLDFLESILGLTSSSHRALIPLLKKLGFIDQHNIPTDAYKNVRDTQTGKFVMAERIKDTYKDIYKANEYAHRLKKEEVVSKLRTVLGVAEDDQVLNSVVGTFTELVKLADFQAVVPPAEKKDEVNGDESKVDPPLDKSDRETTVRPFGLSYTINLNLPATTDIEVFNAIFKSLKEHLIDD